MKWRQQGSDLISLMLATGIAISLPESLLHANQNSVRSNDSIVMHAEGPINPFVPHYGASSSKHIDWRSGVNDGINMLCIYAQLTDSNVRYQKLVDQSQGQPISLQRIKTIADESSIPLQLTKLTPTALSSHLPAIVFLEDEIGAAGQFCLVLRCHKRSVEMVMGTNVEYGFISWDMFRRRWTGHAAIKPVVPRRSIGLPLCVAAGMLIVLVGITYTWRWVRIALIGASMMIGALFILPCQAISQSEWPLPWAPSSLFESLEVGFQSHAEFEYAIDLQHYRQRVPFGFPASSVTNLAKFSDGTIDYTLWQRHVFEGELIVHRHEEVRCDQSFYWLNHFTDWPVDGFNRCYKPPLIQVATTRDRKSAAVATAFADLELEPYGIHVENRTDVLESSVQSTLTTRIQRGWKIESQESLGNRIRIRLVSKARNRREEFCFAMDKYQVQYYRLANLAGALLIDSKGSSYFQVPGANIFLPSIIERRHFQLLRDAPQPTPVAMATVQIRWYSPVRSEPKLTQSLPGSMVINYYNGVATETYADQSYLDIAADRDRAVVRRQNSQIYSQSLMRAGVQIAGWFIIGMAAFSLVISPSMRTIALKP